MRHETAQVFIVAGADTNAIERAVEARVAGLPGLRRVGFARNLEGSWGAGDYTLDLVPGDDAPACDAVFADLAAIAGVARIDHVGCLSIGGGLRDAGLREGIWRTLMLRVRAGASDSQVAALERDLLQMPAFMSGIRNWRLSRVATPGTWTHVWQQEFARADDLLGEYLLHPFHWGWVDRWFDAEHPQWTVEAISHAFCPLASSLLTATAS
ncbi:Dabb family protein [Paraburkholderia silviterrae]|uniref:Dabb family protein n=1 Tax=Paraburkholderia silviterrae TaxID=2528715 RepID=A0A4R5M456_9BURK|nr:Dabb family protein [Paraburkholderia silviterrae]TDG20066.1 Dabb family protein [Paraburkholderia silviterrae]